MFEELTKNVQFALEYSKLVHRGHCQLRAFSANYQSEQEKMFWIHLALFADFFDYVNSISITSGENANSGVVKTFVHIQN